MNSTGALAQLRQGDRPAGLSAEIDSVALLLMELLGRLSLTTRIAAIDRVRTRLDALEVSSLACQMIDADDLRQARRLATTSRRSRRQIERVVQRASVVKRNGDLQVELDQGTLTAEQLDVISSASRRSGGSAASDADLVRRITSVSPDQGRKVADRWLTERLRLPTWTLHTRCVANNGMHTAGDPPTICPQLRSPATTSPSNKRGPRSRRSPNASTNRTAAEKSRQPNTDERVPNACTTRRSNSSRAALPKQLRGHRRLYSPWTRARCQYLAASPSTRAS